MSIYSLSDLGEVMDDPLDRTCTSRLNEIRQRTHKGEEDQTTDIDELIVELEGKFGHQKLKWDIYTKSELDEGLLEGYNWLKWEEVASGLESVQTEQGGMNEEEGASSIRDESVEGSAGTAEMPRAGTEKFDETTEGAEESVASMPQDLADLAEPEVALESVQSKTRNERTEFPVSPTYAGEDVYMTDAPADLLIDDEYMMDVVNSEDRQNDYEYRDAIMSD